MLELMDTEHSKPTNIKVTPLWSTDGRWYGSNGQEIVLFYERNESGFLWTGAEFLSTALEMQASVVPQ
jgi:hypothetical protein